MSDQRNVCELGHPIRQDGSHIRPEDANLHVNGSALPDVGHIPSWHHLSVCRHLAAGTRTRAQIARDFGISRAAVTQFAQRHARQIAEIKANLEDEFAGLWIASKAARLSEYERDAELLPPGSERTAVLKAVAEELGQMPARVNVTVSPVVHVIEGVDTKELT